MDKMAQKWEFPFLRHAVLPAASASRPTLNVFEIAGFPRRETVASNVLAFFLDPNSSHKMGSLFVDALITLLDGAPQFEQSFSQPAKRSSKRFAASAYLGSSAWTVATEAPTSARNRIDVFLANPSLDIAIVIENKLDAPFANPLRNYVEHAAGRFGTVLSALLAPTGRTVEAVPADDSQWLSAGLTFDQLFTAALAGSAWSEHAEPRAVVLLDQFRENVSAQEVAVSSQADLDQIRDFWGALEGQPDALSVFFAALTDVNASLKRRAELLREQVVGCLNRPQMPALASSFVSAGFDHKGGIRAGWVTVMWVGFALEDGVTVELVLGDNPGDYRDLFVKAYFTKTGARDPLAGYSRAPLEATLDSSPESIADEFVDVIVRILSGVDERNLGFLASREAVPDDFDAMGSGIIIAEFEDPLS